MVHLPNEIVYRILEYGEIMPSRCNTWMRSLYKIQSTLDKRITLSRVFNYVPVFVDAYKDARSSHNTEVARFLHTCPMELRSCPGMIKSMAQQSLLDHVDALDWTSRYVYAQSRMLQLCTEIKSIYVNATSYINHIHEKQELFNWYKNLDMEDLLSLDMPFLSSQSSVLQNQIIEKHIQQLYTSTWHLYCRSNAGCGQARNQFMAECVADQIFVNDMRNLQLDHPEIYSIT